MRLLQLVLLFIVGGGIPLIAGAEQIATESVEYCEYVGDQLNAYQSDEQVYHVLEGKARRKAVKRLYAQQLEGFESRLFSHKAIIEKLAGTILLGDIVRKSNGLFTPCIVLENPAISDIDIERFTKVRVSRICNLKMNTVPDIELALRHQFAERLKKFSDNDDAVIEYMINDHKKIKHASYHSLYQMIRTTSGVRPSSQALSDLECHELYVYPIELYLASS